ncbi:MAG TPA: hypothetical protein VIL17_04160 [Coriobacteriia bacterium]
MERTEQENVAEQLTLRMFSAGGRLETKTIRPIEGELPEGLHSLGRSAGTDANVAIGMLYRHCPGFFERVTAYRLVSDPELSAAADSSGPAIEFFERGAQ